MRASVGLLGVLLGVLVGLVVMLSMSSHGVRADFCLLLSEVVSHAC